MGLGGAADGSLIWWNRSANRLAREDFAITAAPDLVNFAGLMDDAKRFAFVRHCRWPEGVRCPECSGPVVIRDVCDDTQPLRHHAGRASSVAAGVGLVPPLYGPGL